MAYADDFKKYPLDLNGMRQIANGVAQSDPIADFRAGKVRWWYQMLLPYASNSRNVFYCPANPSFFRWTNDLHFGIGFSYGWNYFGSGFSGFGMGSFVFGQHLL